MKNFRLLALVLLASYCLDAADAQVDLGNTNVPEGSGRGVTKKVVDLIQQSGFCSDDNDFLFRLAWVESRFGKDPETYRPGFHGGIWQLEEDLFEKTKVSSLAAKHGMITTQFGIDWTQVTWQDLRKPFYSGLGACLFICTINKAIPSSLVLQSVYWYTYYNNREGSVKKFYNDVVVMGDPHISQPILGADQALCYNIFGENNANYDILNEADMEIKISARIAEVEGKKSGKYVGSVKVVFSRGSIMLNTEDVIVDDNKDKFNWDSTFNDFVDTDKSVRLTIDKSGVKIDYLSLVYINVTKIFKSENVFLNLDISHVGRFAETATGILGDVYRSASVLKKEGKEVLSVQQPDNTVLSEPVSHTGACWKLVSHKEASKSLQNIIDDNKIVN